MIVAFVAAGLSIAGLSLSTENLKGEPRVFPADVAQHRAVVVLTFSKSASDQASEWTRRLRENEQRLAASIYQIAVLESVPALFRSLVISSLRRAIPKDLHDHFWIATSSSKEWQERIGSKFLDEAQVFVLEDRSRITWRFHGAFSESTLHSLLAACSVPKN
jgi:ATP synthase subunit 10